MNNKKIIMNDKGFTLLELIIVLTISAIMVLFVGLTFGMINGTNVNKAAKNCEHALVQGRVQSMAKGPIAGTAYIWDDGGDIYIKIGDTGEKEMLCNDRITGYFVQYNHSSGSLSKKDAIASIAAGEVNAKTFVFTNIGSINKSLSTLNGYNGILFQRGTRQTIVFIYPETGKIDITTL